MSLYIVTRPALLANDAKPPLSINGVEVPYEFDTPIELDKAAVAALRDSLDLTVTEYVAEEPEPAAEPEGEGEPDLDPSVNDTDPQSPVGNDGGDGAASPDGGAADGGADTSTEFDPEAVIVGTVAEVTAKLAGLTPEQLALVQAAEIDREQPRKGVTKAIADAIAATQE